MTRRRPLTPMLILDTSMRIVYPSILVLGLYFLAAGHNRPGGGFVGGLMVGAAISLRYVAQGYAAVRATFRLRSHVILGAGLFIAAFTTVLPVLLGGSIMEHGDTKFHLPLFGDVKVTSALPFDFGVALVVIGLVLSAFAAFGEKSVDPIEDPALDEPHGERLEQP